MSTTPNMGLIQPTPGGDTGTWGSELNTSLNTLDAHDHTAGKGTPIPAGALNINADLDFNAHKAVDLNGVQVNSLVSAASGTLNGNMMQSVNGDMWFTNGSGVPVQVTAGNSVASTVSANTPAGIVLPYAGSSAPSGYLFADGTAISRTTYAALFSAIGTSYGVGDGSTTFNLPNMQGRVPVGVGTYIDPTLGSTTRSLAGLGGEASHTLTTAELAAHTHSIPGHSHTATTTITDPGHNHNYGGTSGSGTSAIMGSSAATTATSTSTTGITASTSVSAYAGGTSGSNGSGSAHNNMQPYLVLNYIIKT